jgi:cell division protease FtsH
MSEDERQRVAYHEGGQTILGLLVPGADPVNRVTIVPRGQALGVTYQRPEDDRHNYSREYLLARIVGAMGGRAAEEVVFGTLTTGAENDLARQMVARWGMSEAVGPVTLAPGGNPYLPGVTLIDAEIQRILREAHASGVQLLQGHRHTLDALAAALLDRSRNAGWKRDSASDRPAARPPHPQHAPASARRGHWEAVRSIILEVV